MRILLATGLFPPDIGGPATYSKLLVDEFPKRGISVDVLSFGEVRKYPKVIRHFSYFFKCLARGREVDLIYAQDPVSVGFPALIASAWLNKPFVVRVAGDYAWEQAVQRYKVQASIDKFQGNKFDIKTEFLRKIQRFVVHKADKVITPSKYFQKLVSGWLKQSGKVVAIYNGIDLSDARAAVARVARREAKTLISAGRLVPWKGFKTVIEVLPRLADWKLVIVGDGPEDKALKEIARGLGIESRVTFTGRLPRPELLRMIGESHVFILNTSFESFSYQIVEAMAVGTPVIATDVGNLSEIITDNKEGVLVSPDDQDAIFSAIEKISRDETFRNNIVENARKKAEAFSIDTTLAQTAAILKNALHV